MPEERALKLSGVLQIFEYSLVTQEYTAWSRALLKHGLHQRWLERDTPITHVGFGGTGAAHVLLHDAFMLCVIDQALVGVRGAAGAAAAAATDALSYLCVQPFPHPKAMFYNQMTLRSLPESERAKHSHAFKVCKNFQVGSSGPSESSRPGERQ